LTLSPLSIKFPNSALQIVVFLLNIFTQLGYGQVAYQKELSGPKLMGVLARGACKNFVVKKQVGLGE